jgi:hypothetical protein
MYHNRSRIRVPRKTGSHSYVILQYNIIHFYIIILNVLSYPCRPAKALKSSSRLGLPEFPNKRYMKVVRLSALHTSRLFCPRDIPGIPV